MIPPEELRHVTEGFRPGEVPGGAGLVEIIVHGTDARSVLARVREVLHAVLDQSGSGWPDVADWRHLLPEWFVVASAPEHTHRDNEDWLTWWRQLSPDERVKVEQDQPWSLTDWLHWMQPDNRTWFWWDADVEDEHTMKVYVEVIGWPAPLGALEWLLKAAGASEVWQQEMSR